MQEHQTIIWVVSLVLISTTHVVSSLDVDCKMRQLAYQMSQEILSWRPSIKEVLDALELSDRCPNNTLNETPDQNEPNDDRKNCCSYEKFMDDDDGEEFHVCPLKGEDTSNDFGGNKTHPFATLQRAVQATRENGSQKNRTIVLHPGIHYLNEPLILTAKDSYLTIRGMSCCDGNKAWISGGIFLSSNRTKWKQANVTKTGTNPRSNIWVADLSSSSIKDITGLFTVYPHQRMTLARFPNANVEDWDASDRYLTEKDVKEWILPPFGEIPNMSMTIDLARPDNPTGVVKDDSAMENYNKYGTGQGGSCASVWGDSPSYWCGNVSDGGWAWVDRAAALAGRPNIPQGMILSNESSHHHDWKPGAIVHVAHTQGWAWHMFRVSNVNNSQLDFERGGGSQGGRNWQCKDSNNELSDCNGDGKQLHGGDWYIEGLLEELDEPGEFYFDIENQLLYFYPNYTTSILHADENSASIFRRKLKDPTLKPPPDVVATNFQTLIAIKGTMDNPATNIQILGVGFRDAAKTYMEQWSAPSGGDWALHRGGAIHAEGVENFLISGCHFSRLDGNAILLAGYTRYVNVTRSEFEWIGNSAVATWGDTQNYDATAGTQPRFSKLEKNIIHDVGLYQKQSSAWAQNKACQSVIRENVMFNMPRAAINFNDGLGGDNVVESNVIFNTCRESGDHGAINSWDRMPFLNDLQSPPSFSALPTHTRRNLIFGNYAASQSFDNDDGSSWYDTYKNVFYGSDGFKMDYGGHDSNFYQNLVVVFPFDSQNCYNTASFRKGHVDNFFENICIVKYPPEHRDSIKVGKTFSCSRDTAMHLTNNRYYTLNGSATFGCGDNNFELHAMQELGMEVGSLVDPFPLSSQVMTWAFDILFSREFNSVGLLFD